MSPNEGLSVGVTAGATMGDPKVTILESGRVGVNSSQPQSTLQVSGGSLFVGANVANDNGFNHGSIPLLVTNQTTSAPTTPSPVFALARQGAGTNYGSKAQFNMAQSTIGANSSTRLDIDLADTSYDAVNCMTLRSDGKTGFGAQVPTAAWCTLEPMGREIPLKTVCWCLIQRRWAWKMLLPPLKCVKGRAMRS